MNISPFRKQIQKFFLFIVIILISFSIFPVLAQAQSGGPRGSTCTDTAIISNSVQNFVKDRNKVQWEENFNVQVRLTFKNTAQAQTVAKDCEASGKNSYQFIFYLYDGTSSTNVAYKPGKSVKANFFADKKSETLTEYGFIAQQSVNIKALMGNTPKEPGAIIDASVTDPTTGQPYRNPDPANGFIYTYFLGSSETRATGELGMTWTKASVTGDPVQSLPPLPGGINADQETTPDPDTIAFDQLFFGVKIKSATNDTHRNFFRISSDGNIAVPDSANAGKNKVITFAAFDQAGGIPVTLSLAEQSAVNALKIGSSGTSITYRKIGSDYPTLSYFLGQSHRAYKVFLVNVEDKNQKNKDVCAVSVFSATQYSCDKAKIKEVDTGVTLLTKGDEVEMPIKLAAGKSLSSIGITGSSGSIVTLNVLPTINTGSDWTQWITQSATIFVTAPITFSNGFAPAGFSYGKEPVQKVHFQIYATKAELEAHKDDAIPSTVPAYADAVTGNTESSGQSAGKTLYDFIVSIILTIVVFLTSQIYEIFAFFVVPVLNALLKVRPYQDAFVNIIYPGWLILRNLANIFFIISLLVVGLRILFQQSAASTARGFIMRLIIMALLVNFSLVIGQGIVGIADTVQSQFLPKDSKVIEALGTKLMVDPVKSFRSAITGSETGQIKGDPNIGDVTKPLVMLILAVAAFFSFLAIAAFLAVRLVALMILYMVSPVAYVGFVMDETRSYAKRWWDEFLKYAFVTPILVFFLNIAALVAVSTASNSGTVFQIGDGIADNLVEGGLTIISHFIVLLIIFAGMKFALSSGHAGAKTIVDYAQKGFNNLTTRPAKWLGGQAADLAKSTAQTQWDRRFKGGMLDPLAYRDAYKKRVADTTKQKYSERMLKNANRFSPAGLFEDPSKTLKYLYYKGTNRGAQKTMLEAEAKIDKSETLTAPERKSLDNKLAGEEARLTPLDQVAKKLNANTPLSVKEGEDLLKHLTAEESRLGLEGADRAAELRSEAATLKAEGNIDASNAKLNQADGIDAEYKKKKDDIQKMFKELEPVVNNAVAAGKTTLALDDELKADITDRIDNDVKDLEKEIKTLTTRRDEDNRRLSEYKITAMTLDERRALQNDANKLNVLAAQRSAPQSSVARQVRREREDEEKKKVEETDDSEELIAQYKKAMAKNNLPLASAIAKKMASEGNFNDLLKEHGYRNNMQAFQEMIGEHFKKYAPSVRLQIMSEIGTLNEKNGNRAASRATKIDAETGQMRLATPQEHRVKHNTVLAKQPMSKAKQMKKNEFGEEGADGRLNLYSGAAKMLSQFKSIKKPPALAAGATPTKKYTDDVKAYERKILEYQRDMAPTAKAILEATNSHLIDKEAIAVLKDIAMK